MKYLIAILLIAVFYSCNSNKPTPPEETATASVDESSVKMTPAQVKTAGIQLGNPEMKAVQSTLKLTGVVEVPPQNIVSVSFPMGGFFKHSPLLPGMKVSKGQVIAVMEDQSFIQLQQEYLVARSRLQLLEKEYARQKELNINKTSSDKVVEQALNDYQTQKINVRALGERLSLIGINPNRLTETRISRTVNIYSPINGYVSQVNSHIGKYVNPSDILFELIDPRNIHLALTVFEKELRQIRPGQLINARLTTDPSRVYPARVSLISKDLDANRSGMVHAHFEGSMPELTPGMYMNAEIGISSDSALTLPEEAVVRYGDKEYIFLDQGDNTFQLTPVTSGNREGGMVQIRSEIAGLEDQKVVIRNAYAVLMKMKNAAEEE
ncbi:MAG TPA: efflux RND transporter periplasmic adaptor subunit [Sphingobacteriaceae bacterium]